MTLLKTLKAKGMATMTSYGFDIIFRINFDSLITCFVWTPFYVFVAEGEEFTIIISVLYVAFNVFRF